jgi:hypothetical protein
MQLALGQETHNQEANPENRISAIAGFCYEENNREHPI